MRAEVIYQKVNKYYMYSECKTKDQLPLPHQPEAAGLKVNAHSSLPACSVRVVAAKHIND